MGFVGNGVQVWLVAALLISCVLLSSSSRNLISENYEEMKMRVREGRRGVVASVNDYDDPSANTSHDPPSVSKVSGKNTGRRG